MFSLVAVESQETVENSHHEIKRISDQGEIVGITYEEGRLR
jgi:hypothetical protein